VGEAGNLQLSYPQLAGFAMKLASRNGLVNDEW
jgi:hypothetical protein